MNPKQIYGDRKAPTHLVPPILVLEAAVALGEGGRKYGPHNWRAQPVNASTYIAAIQRHLAAFQDGENIDPDSAEGKHHLGAIAACCAILLDSQALGILVDDRSTGPGAEHARWASGTPCDAPSTQQQRGEMFGGIDAESAACDRMLGDLQRSCEAAEQSARELEPPPEPPPEDLGPALSLRQIGDLPDGTELVWVGPQGSECRGYKEADGGYFWFVSQYAQIRGGVVYATLDSTRTYRGCTIHLAPKGAA